MAPLILRRFGAAALVCGLLSSSTVFAQAAPRADAPLAGAELEAVLDEIEEMVKTDTNQVETFRVRQATPERIERLFRSPGLTALPATIRENGLIFAGRGSTRMAFDKPSDVVAKLDAWFPEELARARQAKSSPFRGLPRLWGPYDHWDAEPAAFVSLWQCMPQSAWLNPQRSPFVRRPGDSLPLFPIAARQSSEQEFDFGFCVRERSGYRPGRPGLGAAKAVPVLRTRFARHLERARCRGTGPDDCVLVLHLWASLAPEDAELAAAIRALEADIGPDKPLPAMRRAWVSWSASTPEDGQDRFDEALRRAAFLRAKLRSVQQAPKAWPAEALPATLAQMTRLRQVFAEPFAHRWQQYDLGYANPSIDPWRVLETGSQAGAGPRAAVIAELQRVDGGRDCEVFTQWFGPSDPALKAEYTLGRLQAVDARAPGCGAPDWAWLAAGSTDAARTWRARFVALANQTPSAALREQLLSRLTHDGDDCFAPASKPAPEWQRALCRQWIHEPATVPLALPHTRLVLDAARQFQRLAVQAPSRDEAPQAARDPHAWLAVLTEGMHADVQARMRAYLAELARQQSVRSAVQWRHPGHSRALVQLGLADNEGTQRLLVLSPHGLQAIEVPARLSRGGDRQKIVRVSDLDEDGNLELWWADAFDGCQDDDSDLQRTVDCAAKGQTAAMGEVSGDTLSYFADSRAAAPRPGPDERWAARGGAQPLPDAFRAAAQRERRPCNRVLVGSVLVEELGIEQWRAHAPEGREVIDLACAPHPLYPEQTLVALFHQLPPAEPAGEAASAERADEAPAVGFVAAVIDIGRGQVLSVYRDQIEQDASIRIGEFSLRLDTARYELAPKVRAFGVRMDIGHSPRYAEGGESDYLTLFVEQGRRLRAVLKQQAMSAWSMVDSTGCFDDAKGPCVIEQRRLTLALSPRATNGWRDLEVFTTTTIDGDPKAKPVTRRTGTLRAVDGVYR